MNTADLFDDFPAELSVCDLQFRTFGKRRSFSGPCATVLTSEDHRPVLKAVSTPGNGRVLVVDVAGSMRIGVMGDRLAAIAVANGWVGVVINGLIRDSKAIDGLEIGVKCLGTTARRSEIERGGLFDVVLHFGGVRFTPGAWVYADEDAVTTSEGKLEPLTCNN